MTSHGAIHLSYRVALGGLAAVLLVLSIFGISSALRTSHASKRASVSSTLSDAYQRARYSVGQEESLERKYRLEPSREVRAKYDAAASEFAAALGGIAATGTPADRALTARLLGVQADYLRAIRRMFSAVDARDDARVLDIDGEEVDPRFATIEARVAAAATAHRRVATRDLRGLRDTERSVLTATPAVFALGLLLLAFLTLLLARINRQLARSARDSEHNALHDALTGLPNRVLFADRLEHAIAAARRDPAPFSILMIDLDRFKEINDSLGHNIGDRLLSEIGPRLAPILRPGDSLARLGGDEFALLLPAAGTEQAKLAVGRVLAALREPFVLPELTLTVDASVGIVTYPTHGQDAETLVQRADIAMYLAKEHGRSEMLYDPAEDPYDPERLLLTEDLRDAIGAGELIVHYQPKYAAGDLQLIGVEALVRWQHPGRGLLPPGDFIPLAEHTGLIRPLTLEVIRQAAHQWRDWEAAGHELTVAVNLSLANLLDGRLMVDIAEILAAARMPAERLLLEITETTVMSDPTRSIAILQRLADTGIQLSIDDYGTGLSSLAYLRRLPVHELKIDRSFIQNLATDPDDNQIVRSTIDLGHSLGLEVVAEGVENAAVLAVLQDYGCDILQGFHLGRPLPPEALLERLEAAAPALA